MDLEGTLLGGTPQWKVLWPHVDKDVGSFSTTLAWRLWGSKKTYNKHTIFDQKKAPQWKSTINHRVQWCRSTSNMMLNSWWQWMENTLPRATYHNQSSYMINDVLQGPPLFPYIVLEVTRSRHSEEVKWRVWTCGWQRVLFLFVLSMGIGHCNWCGFTLPDDVIDIGCISWDNLFLIQELVRNCVCVYLL